MLRHNFFLMLTKASNQPDGHPVVMPCCSQVQVEYLATAEGLQEAANAAAVEYIGIEQGALVDESGNLIHSAK